MTAIDTGAAAPPATEPPVPYVGPRSLRPDEPIYGRTREINDLRGEILSERIVLLYSQSGAGKTSLIEAGLRPELEKRRFQILPTIRVGYEAHAEATSANRYRLSVITSLEAGRHLENQLAPDELTTITLADYLRQRADDEPDADPCLIFDQFEEVFTLDPADWDEKEEFLRELGDALSDRRFFALFSMREDFIAQLDPFQTFMPTQFGNRYRLELLGPAAAREAIQMPAARAGVEFSDDAADRLVDDLRRIRVDRGTESTLELGPNIEPVQLQVVCSQLWERLPPDATSIQPDDVVAGGNVNEALAGYYSSQVHTVAAQTHVREIQIRDWFEDKLITDDGFRTQTREGPGQKGNEVLPALENAHLIRADRRRGTLWYELTHDRFVEPIRVSNTAYRAARRTRRNRRLLILVGAVLVLSLAAIVGLAMGDQARSDGTEQPAEELSGTNAAPTFPLEASQVKRFRFNDGQQGDEVTLVITFESADPGSVLPTEVDVRLLQVGTPETEGLDPGETLAVAPSGSTEEASATTTTEVLLEGSESSTTSTTKAVQETARPIQRVFVLPATGSYLIEITANNAATAVLSYSRQGGSTVPELVIGATAQGSLDAAGAVGRFEFVGEAGETIELVLDPQDPLDGVLVLMDPDGNPIDSVDVRGPAGREVIITSLPTAGTYAATVSGFEASTGPYGLTLRHPEVTPIASGDTLEGTISEENDTSTFSFAANAGEVISVTVQYDDTLEPSVEVSGDSGRQVSYSDGLGGPIEYVGFWTGGAGYITISDVPTVGGSFAVTFEGIEGTEIEIGATIDAAPPSGRPEFYTFSGIAGEIYAVTMTGTLGLPEVFAPEGVEVFASPFVAPFDGGYVVRVAPEASEVETLSVTQPQLPELRVGEQSSGVVESPRQQVAYRFTADAGVTYSISFDWTGGIAPWMLLVTAPDGRDEAFLFPWETIDALDEGLACDDIFALGLTYAEADLYFSLEGADDSRSRCRGVYPAAEINDYWESGQSTRLTLEVTAPFAGEYLFVVAIADLGSYVVVIDG